MKDEFSNGSDLMKKNMDEEDLASLVIQQIEFCNIILLNKAAEVEPNLKQIIRAIQPKAEIFECNYGDVDLNLIVNTKKFDWETVSTSAGWIQEIESERNEEHEEDDEEDTYRIVTTVREDVLNGIISNISPMGKALLGHKVGDRVEVVPGKGDPFHIVIREIVKTTDESQDHIR